MTVAERIENVVNVHGIDIEVRTYGTGAPLLLLPGEEQLEVDSRFVEELSRSYKVIVPSPPGFGISGRPEWITNPDDLAYVMLDLAEMLGIENAPLVGCSLGGWIAAEMVTKDDSRFSRMVLIDPYGVKIGGPFDVDIQDMWILHPSKVAAMKWHDQAKGKRDFSVMNDDQLAVVARNVETFARFCWEPYMHNPKLRHRLHRVTTPTLVLWGANDGVAAPSYGKAYAGLIPGAKFETIADAGHYPQIEQPEAVLKAVRAFLA
ncbi:MAG: alpha/beta hydrolase [Beijerinckiaceae bacterium]|nr:alpha/beta hydrolase [Beijerinckiaceae bacterium]